MQRAIGVQEKDEGRRYFSLKKVARVVLPEANTYFCAFKCLMRAMYDLKSVLSVSVIIRLFSPTGGMLPARPLQLTTALSCLEGPRLPAAPTCNSLTSV